MAPVCVYTLCISVDWSGATTLTPTAPADAGGSWGVVLAWTTEHISVRFDSEQLLFLGCLHCT